MQEIVFDRISSLAIAARMSSPIRNLFVFGGLSLRICFLTSFRKSPPPQKTSTYCSLLLIKRPYLAQSVFKVVLQKSTPPQIHQIILRYYQHEELADGIVRESIFAERLYQYTRQSKAGFWPWLSRRGPLNLLRRSLFVWKRYHKVVFETTFSSAIRDLFCAPGASLKGTRRSGSPALVSIPVN